MRLNTILGISVFLLPLIFFHTEVNAQQHYTLLSGGVGSSSGYCDLTIDKDELTVNVHVFGATPLSSLTVWKAINGPTVGRLDGGYTDSQGDIRLAGVIPNTSDLKELTFKVRDHQRTIDEILDETDLNIELNQSKSNNAANSNINLGECSFDLDVIAPNNTGLSVPRFEADVFYGSRQPEYVSGFENQGVYSIQLGGVDSFSINNMSGAWMYDFEVPVTQSATIIVEYEMTTSPDFEPDEVADVMIWINGALNYTVLRRIAGDGNGGNQRATGRLTASIDINPIVVGSYRLAVGGYLNKKTASNEWVNIDIHNVSLELQ